MKDYRNATIKDYLNDLSSGRDAPGGGSASALSAAIGASLGAMVCEFTIGKKKYADVEDRIKEILVQIKSSRDNLFDLMQRDVDVFHNEMGKAYSLPKNTEQQKQDRKQAIEQACKACVQPPLEITRECIRLLKILIELAEKGNAMLISDIGVACELICGAFEGAKLNVEINLKYISDEKFVTTIQEEIFPASAELTTLSEQIMRFVRNKLNGK